MSLARALLLAAVCAASGAASRAQDQNVSALVSAVQRENEWFCSISAPRAPLSGIIEQLAHAMVFEVEGLERISPTALVTVELRDRPVSQALEWVLGISGLCAKWRTGVLEIQPAVPEPPTTEELRDCALAAYTGALRSFPDASAGAAAAFAKASIFERRGDLTQAIASYDSLVRAFPQAKEAPEALMRAARLLHGSRDWSGAADHYADLLRLSSFSPYVLEARLGFADNLSRKGDFRTALRLISALDTSNPALTRLEVHHRLLVRARCMLGDNDAAGARELLRVSENGGLEPELEADYWELCALSLPGDAPPEYASTVWLEYARRAPDEQRAHATAEAARLTLLSGDELGTLWIDRWAAQNGLGDSTAPHAIAAREALGLAGHTLANDPNGDRLARAERLMHARLWSEAHAAFAQMQGEAQELDEPARTRLFVGMAQCLEQLSSVDEAIAVLRNGLELVREPEHRRELFVTAASIFEAHDRVDDAIEAYRGRL